MLLFLLPHLLGYLIHLIVQRLLGGFVGKVFLPCLLNVRVQVCDELSSLFYLGFKLRALGFKLVLLVAKLGKRLLVVRLGLLGRLAGGLVFFKQTLVGVHNLTDVVHCTEQFAEAVALEKYVQVSIVAIFLHGAHTLAVQLILLVLRFLRLLQFRGLLVNQLSVEVNLLVDELYLLDCQLVLLVKQLFLLQHSLTFGHQFVDV